MLQVIAGLSLVAASAETKKGALISPYCYTTHITGKNYAIFHLLSIALSSLLSFAIAFAVYSVMKRSQVNASSVRK